jgi:hypothetical protein
MLDAMGDVTLAPRVVDDAGTSVPAYYRRVIGRAWEATRAVVGRHLAVTIAVLTVTYGLGFLVGERLRVATLTELFLIPLAAIGLVGVAAFIAQLMIAPVRRAREAALSAAEKASALEAQIPSMTAGPYVTARHEESLRGMLEEDRAALEHRTRRNRREPLEQEMFAAHFRALEGRLVEWDRVVARKFLAPVKLRERFLYELSRLELDLPYELGTLATGLTSITTKHALNGPPVAGDAHSPALNASDHLWGAAWTHNYVPAEDDLSVLAESSLAQIRSLLLAAGEWPEVHEMLSAHEPLLVFPRTELLETIKRTQLKPKIPVASGCPGCE